MLGSVSPYALLRASMPRQSAGAATAYDLYSLAQGSGGPAERADAAAPLPQENPQPAPSPAARPSAPPAAPAPARRTHYISDIQNRHAQAARRTAFGPVNR